eukprot:13920694-Alexandrium_andersonii.AAC.1
MDFCWLRLWHVRLVAALDQAFHLAYGCDVVVARVCRCALPSLRQGVAGAEVGWCGLGIPVGYAWI